MNGIVELDSNRHTALCLLALLIVLLFTFWVYVPGFDGPLVFDDQPNLVEVTRYVEGQKTASHVIFDNRSGRLGRPVSMATFVADAAAWGNSSWHAKRTNLLIHLFTGVLVFWLVLLLCEHSSLNRRQAALVALAVSAVWLLAPVQVSTVLYLVQRMAQLSALFMIAGLITFIHARRQLDSGQTLSGSLLLWLGVPLFTLLAAFSKENGALLPLLALIVELVWFRSTPDRPRPRMLLWFFSLTVLLPALALAVVLLSSPSTLLGGFERRHFSLWERLLTQSRVLWSYVSAILLPTPGQHGIYHDHYVISRGLFQPITTAMAILGWLVLGSIAFVLRHRAPLILGGLLLFLGGHLLESTIFPLEIYFEHRNYFPSVGLLLAVAGLIVLLAQQMSSPTRQFRVLLLLMVAALGPVLALATSNQVAVWSSSQSFYEHHLTHNPESFRMHSYLLVANIERGEYFVAEWHIDQADQLNPFPGTLAPVLWRFYSRCEVEIEPEDELYEEMERRVSSRITRTDMVAVGIVSTRFESGNCPGLDFDRFRQALKGWLSNSTLEDTSMEHWRTRYYLARMYASTGRFDEAIALGEKAWRDSGFNRGVGVFFFQINAEVGDVEACRRIVERLERSTGRGDLLFDEAVSTFRSAVEQGLDNLPDPEHFEADVL